MRNPRHPDLIRRILACLAAMGVGMAGHPLRAASVVLQLKDGDRLSGSIVSESASQVVLSNQWAGALAVPVDQIARREQPGAEVSAPAAAPLHLQTQSKPTAPLRKSGRIQGEAQVGLDMLYGDKQQRLYNGRVKMSYEQPYRWEPKEMFKNGLDYCVEYGRTDGVKSSDRMNGSDQMDLDIGLRQYVYNLAGIGYDHVRRIDLGYEEGPGLGYRLFNDTNFMFNLEGGANYQSQDRSDSQDVQDFFWRLAQDFKWKMRDRTMLTGKVEFTPRVNWGEYRFRMDSTLSYELWRNFLLNFTVLDQSRLRPGAGREPEHRGNPVFSGSEVLDGDRAGEVELKDLVDGGGEVGKQKIVMNGSFPWRFKDQRGATGGAGGFRIIPLVADHEGTFEVQLPFEFRFDQQSRFGLAARATVRFRVRAHKDIVQRERAPQRVVHAIQLATRQMAVRQPGLIGRGNQNQPRCF